MDVLRIAARVAAVPTESRIRHKDRSKRFDLAEFKALPSTEEMHRYAHFRLEALGRGSSRAVYALTGSKVLKIAAPLKGHGTSDAGVAQNTAEADVYTDPKTKPVCAAVYDADPEYRWLISEMVRPLSGDDEFAEATGMDIDTFALASSLLASDMSVGEVVEELRELGQAVRDTAMLEILANLMDRGLDEGDLVVPGHWGKSASGKTVLLDYGFTTGVFEEFYKENTGSGGATADSDDG